MKHHIDELSVEDNKLQNFLQWVDEKAVAAVDLDQVPYKYVACRAFYISEFDLLHPLDPKLSEDFAIAFEPSVNPDVERAYDEHIALWEEERMMEDMRRIHDPTWEPPTPAKHEPYVRKIALNPYLYLDYQLPDWLEKTKDGETAVHSLEQNCRLDLEFPPFAIDPQLHQKLQALCVQFKEYREEDWDYWKQWWQDNGQVWVNQLRTAMIEHRNIGHDWQFSDEQKEQLQQYYDANKLLVDCLNSDRYVSRAVRQEIEDTLLLPIAKIEKRRKSS